MGGGCRNDCPPCPSCDPASCKCTPCTCFASAWKAYVQWMSTAEIAGLFVFEWTDENWKGGAATVGANFGANHGQTNAFCFETKSRGPGPGFDEANHGLFTVQDNQLVAKSIGNRETFASVLGNAWATEMPGAGGFRGWLIAQSTSSPRTKVVARM